MRKRGRTFFLSWDEFSHQHNQIEIQDAGTFILEGCEWNNHHQPCRVFSDDSVFKSQILSVLQSTHSLCVSHTLTHGSCLFGFVSSVLTLKLDRDNLDHQSPVCSWTEDMSSVCVAGQTHLHVSSYLRESSSKDFSSLKHTNRKRLVIKVGHTAEDRQGQCQTVLRL